MTIAHHKNVTAHTAGGTILLKNVEAANAAGDNYNVRETQFADGICTMISALCGGVVPNTVWLGHAGLKKSNAGIGYSLVSGLVLGAAGLFGLFSFLSNMVPPASPTAPVICV